MNAEWRGPINQLLYSLIFTREITDKVVTDCADAAVNYTWLGLGPEVYYWAINEALASGDDPIGRNQLPQFDRAEIERFLRALSARLDELRPWQVPKFFTLNDLSPWSGIPHEMPIAELDVSLFELSNLLRDSFDRAGDSMPGQYVLALRLRTGETVALLGSHATDVKEEKVLMFTDSVADPDLVIEHFTDLTEFPVDKVRRI
jgi:hypothetical protein